MKFPLGMTYNDTTNKCDDSDTKYRYRTQNDKNDKNDNGGVLQLGPIFDACDSSSIAVHPGWPLPTINELRVLEFMNILIL
ncbi:MAG: hypothetical protein VYA34_04115 [Myxococcota bacterium]|nr:hypothetical protein [Myxococcota bacterium]